MADDDEQPTQVLSGAPQPPRGGTATLEPREPRIAEGGGGGGRPPYPPTGYGGDGNGDDWGDGDDGSGNDRRVAILGAVIGILVVIVLFLVLRPGGDDLAPSTTSEAAVTATAEPAAEATPTAEPEATTEATPEATATPAAGDDAGNGGASGGATVDGGGDLPTLGNADSVTKFTVSQGDDAKFRVVNDTDQPQEVHVHGYDKSYDVGPGEAQTISFTANITGIFEIEFEATGTQIGELTVEP